MHTRRIIAGLVLASSLLPIGAVAQPLQWGGATQEIYEHTVREEAEGKELWGKLQAKETACGDLDAESFARLGEYFMGVMTGASHAAMNAMMIQAHGEEGEERIHEVMGRRLSGCETDAALPAQSYGWMPMMWGGWGGGMMGMLGAPAGTSDTGAGYRFSVIGFAVSILWWIALIVGAVFLARWLAAGSKGARKDALAILEERYARGEITKAELEGMKKDIRA